jgi:hypothetical protein
MSGEKTQGKVRSTAGAIPPPPPTPDCDVTRKTDKDDLCSVYVAKMYAGSILSVPQSKH